MANKVMLAVAGSFLLLGLASLIVGIVLPITLHNRLVSEGLEASRIFSTDHPDVWANMPGDRGYNLTRRFEFFEIKNPEDYKYGIQPVAASVGTVVYNETRETISSITEHDVVTYEGKDEVMFEFTQNINLQLASGEEIISKEINAVNPEVFAQLAANRDASPWHIAIRGLKQLIDFTVNGFYRRAIVAQLNKRVDYYTNKDSFLANRGNLLTQNGVSTEAALLVLTNSDYGFADRDNKAFWAKACDKVEGGFNRRILIDFFGLNSNAMNAFMTQFCIDWDAARDDLVRYACVTNI